MGLSAAERAKKYRDSLKSDPIKHAQYLQKERERYKKRKASGEYDISKKSEREKNYIRRQWRKKKQTYRQQQRMNEKGINFMEVNSPTTSPETSPLRVRIERPPQHASGRKKVKKERAKAYRTIGKLQNEVNRYKRLWENYRKKEQRLRKHVQKGSKTSVQKTGVFDEVIVKALAKRFKESKGEMERKLISSVVSKDLLMKSRIQRQFTNETGISYYRLVSNAVRADMKDSYKRTGRSVVWRIEMRKKVKKFLEEDINSVQAPGKKDTITRNGKKMQKRYLADTLKNLFQKYLEKYPGDTQKLSYSSFCRLRPFWIVAKKTDARDTCLCKLHANVKSRIEKLHQLKVINSKNPDKISEQLVCDLKNKACSYGDCIHCKNKLLCSNNLEELGGNQVTFSQWANRSENIPTKDGKSMRNVQKTVKQTEQVTVDVLFNETVKMIKAKYIKHIFNIRNQYMSLKDLKDNVDTSEAVIHVDFSENYNCKMSEEVQSMHFGGSRNQISLHTVVVYSKAGIKSFCTVSENTYHGPGAIWAHMFPILQEIKETMPQIRTLHFVSNGPSTQYRSKNNFYMFNKEVLENFEFQMGSWNFTESGHGKGAADGIGGVVKRTADAIVSMGTDISDAKSFYEEVSKRVNNVRLFLIASEDIDKVTASIPTHIPTIKGTMKLHQVVINIAHRGIMHLRELSCFCTWPTCCKCYIAETSECILMSQHDSVSPSNNDADKRCETGRTTNMDCRSQGVFTHDTIYREPQTPPTDVEALKTPKNVDPQKILTKIEPHPDLIGNWCVVRYDDKAYPGIIQDLDDDSAEVKVMHRIGENRYFWPYLEDCIWYNWENLLMLIPEPLHVTGRHVQIDPSHWTEVKHMLNE